MRTSERIFHKITWDDRLDATRFTFAIDVHRAAPKRVAVVDFDPHGDIPWHRVLFVEFDGERCWDRSGLDTVDAIADSGEARPRRLPPTHWEPRRPYRWNGHAWAAAPPDEPEVREQLRTLTWNILWDRYDADRIDSAARWPRLLQHALDADVDIIALQEVQPAFHRLVLQHPEVRAHWWVSHPSRHRDIGEYDLLLLGRIGVAELGFTVLSPHKAALSAALSAGVVVITTHLSSDHSRDASASRTAQLDHIAAATATIAEPQVLMGDVNLFDEVGVLDTVDAWTSLHPARTTFDPARNPLAAVGSRTGRAGRLDRVLLTGEIRAVEASLLGDAPIDERWLSDHAGLRTTLSLVPDDRVHYGPTTVRSALAWLPPEHAWPGIQAIRRERDARAHRRWPPHINLLWPFVPEGQLSQAAAALTAAAEAPAFSTELDELGCFDNRTPCHFLGPSDTRPWTALHARLRRSFPTAGRPEFQPHLTVARGGGAPEVPPVPADVDRLAVLTRRGDEPFAVRAWLHLGSGIVEWLDEAVHPIGEPAPIDDLLSALPTAILVGSYRLGVAIAGSDVDLLWPGPLDIPAIVDALTPTSWTEAPKAGLPGLQLDCQGRLVDIVCTHGDSETAHLARTAIADADALLDAVDDLEAFRELTRFIKGWAQVHMLHDAALGGLEGLAWAVLCAEISTAGSLEERALAFFSTQATRDWGPDDEVHVLTPTEPRRTITLRAHRWRLEEALLDAWEHLDHGGDLTDLLRPPAWHQRYAEAVVVLGEDDDARGRARGRAIALMSALGRVHPRLVEGGFALGLPSPTGVDDIVATWLRGMSGVTATRVQSDEISPRR